MASSFIVAQLSEDFKWALYEEQAHIRKEPVVRQEVNIRKVTEKDTVTAQENVRREELDVTRKRSPDIVDHSR
ncbi:MAG: DUF2382 domain-containing protein [Leptolyngbyaceae cyanobacterium]